jgi:hypothetical protein
MSAFRGKADMTICGMGQSGHAIFGPNGDDSNDVCIPEALKPEERA